MDIQNLTDIQLKNLILSFLAIQDLLLSSLMNNVKLYNMLLKPNRFPISNVYVEIYKKYLKVHRNNEMLSSDESINEMMLPSLNRLIGMSHTCAFPSVQ